MLENTILNDVETVYGSIINTDFQKITTAFLSAGLIEQFEELERPLNDKMIANIGHIKSLEKLRDTLLPKLMSGEERVAI